MMMTTKHDDILSNILRGIATAALHILALPFVLLAAVTKIRRFIVSVKRLNAGRVTCPYCSAENALNMMTRCPTCGAVEPGSRLRCSFCHAVYDVLPCGGCGATLRVL